MSVIQSETRLVLLRVDEFTARPCWTARSLTAPTVRPQVSQLITITLQQPCRHANITHTPGLVTGAKAGTDMLKYSVTDTVTGPVATVTQNVSLTGYTLQPMPPSSLPVWAWRPLLQQTAHTRLTEP